MRLIDVIAVLLLAAFLLLSLLKAKRWRVWSAALLGLTVTVELARISGGHETWQMYPALAVLASSLLATPLMYRANLRRWSSAHRKSRIAATLILLVLLAGTPIAYTLFPMFELPRPTGALGVGTLELHLVDRSRPEVHTADPLDHRELMVKVW